jgi:hypothetical protein
MRNAASCLLAWGGIFFVACEAPAPLPVTPSGFKANLNPTELGLQVLRGKLLAEQLEKATSVVVPLRPAVFGETVQVSFQIQNMLGEELHILEPSIGLIMQIRWEVEQWLPTGAVEKLTQTRNAVLDRSIALEAGEVFRESSPLDLDIPGNQASLWKVTVGATMRTEGLRIGDAVYPVSRLQFLPSQFFVFPGGWESLATDTLGQFQRIVKLNHAELDRHILVCCALLPEAQRFAAATSAIRALAKTTNYRRAATLTTALAWLTKKDFGSQASAWIAWGEGLKMLAGENLE